MIFVDRPYLTAVDVTERRNLVYNFRSLLSRDPKGHLIAGIYFKVKEDNDEFTIFYQNSGKQRLKLRFSSFLMSNAIGETVLKAVNECNDQLNLPPKSLLEMLSSLAKLNNDKEYIRQLLDINNSINSMTDV